jgi:tRNA threonylcarbamoyl adenosine modification protein (Sua5/YciO/YrdC/YwlC family)
MLLPINPHNPQERYIQQVVDCLRDGGVIIYPTDTVYALGCDIANKHAIERVARIKGINPDKAQFSCVCGSLKTMGEYTIHVSTPVYKILKNGLPGPYTFILEASKQIPRHFQSRRKTVGIRVLDHPIPNRIVELLGNPLMNASLPPDPETGMYETDPERMHDIFHKLVDMVVDGGPGGTEPSTIIDFSASDGIPILIRQGKGDLETLGIETED